MAPFGRRPSTAAADSPQPDHATLLSLIRQHGSNIMAYSKLQPGLEHFYVPNLGCVSYCTMQVGPPFLFKWRPAVLADPLCSLGDREKLTALFLERHPRAFFVQVSRDYALLLQRKFGLRATCMGGETELDVAGGYDLSGSAKHPLRNAAVAAEREGCYVRELRARRRRRRARQEGAAAEEAAAEEKEEEEEEEEEEEQGLPDDDDGGGDYEDSALVQAGLRRVDAAWSATKGAHHAARIWFINRAPVFEPEPGVRKFVAWQRRPRDRDDDAAATCGGSGNGDGGGAARKDGDSTNTNNKTAADDREMVAYVFFDPVYEDGRMCGAYANVTRISPDAPHGCLNLIMREALAQFRRELEGEAAAKKAAAAVAKSAVNGRRDHDNDDLAAQRDQDGGADEKEERKLSRKERLALKTAALAARGLSPEELRAQRAAKKQQAAAAAASGSAGGKAASPNNTEAAPAPAPAPAAAPAAWRRPPKPKSNSNTNNNLPPFFVSLGMAPFFALGGDAAASDPAKAAAACVDPDIPGERSATRVMELVYEYGQTFYPYKAIAFSKTRYGGGLDEKTRTFPRDPAARWRPVYAASSLDAPTFVALFDLGALVGFWEGPFNAIATFVRYEWSGLKRRLQARMRRGGKAGCGCGGGGGGNGDDGGAALAAFGAVGLGQQREQQHRASSPAPVTTREACPATPQPHVAPPPSPSFASAVSDGDGSGGSSADATASVEDVAAPVAGGSKAAAVAFAPVAAAVAVN
jgi:hypothetical protein